MSAEPSITCPRCGMTSYHPEDIRAGYCGNCHDWTGTRSESTRNEPEAHMEIWRSGYAAGLESAVADLTKVLEEGETVELVIQVADAWALLANLQLALRHPGNTGDASQRGRRMAHRLEELVARTPALRALAQAGWDPEQDVRP